MFLRSSTSLTTTKIRKQMRTDQPGVAKAPPAASVKLVQTRYNSSSSLYVLLFCPQLQKATENIPAGGVPDTHKHTV